MKRYGTVLFALMLLASPLWAAPPTVKIDPEVKPSGQYVTFLPGGDAVNVLYVGLSGVDPIPSGVLKDGRMFLLDTRGLREGRYKFTAVGASKEGEQTRVDFVVVVGNVPPGPDPGPGPQPPDPPTPTDPLTKALQAAYDKETDADKAKHRASLAALYRQAAEIAAKPEIATWGQLFAVMKSAAGTLGVSGKLPLFQAAVAEELKTRFPTDAARVMTTDDRVLAAQTFKRIAQAAEGVK